MKLTILSWCVCAALAVRASLTASSAAVAGDRDPSLTPPPANRPAAEAQPAADAKRYFPADPPDAPAYTLPEALTTSGGETVTTARQWNAQRRSQILELYRAHVYGRVPATPFTQTAKVMAEDRNVLDGTATRKDIEITLTAGDRSLVIPMVLYTPNAARGPAPAFLLMGNSKVELYDPMRSRTNGYWPVEYAIRRGYAMAAFWSWDVDPDEKTDTGFKDGAHALLDRAPRTGDSWATIAAWAWGMSRCLDYLVTDRAIAGDQVAVVGHSRAGKTALWATAQDERFAMACSNDSGCTGAALFRHPQKDKERIAAINQYFPHWFAANFKGYNGREDTLPVDQHMLISLIAPRAVCVASADQDLWADPRGEFLSVVAARPVYALFGRKALGDVREMPAIAEDLHGDGTHYHLRAGKHALTLADWTFYLDAADQEFGRTARQATGRAGTPLHADRD